MEELEGIVSSADLGQRLGLPASPAIVLGEMAAGGRAVLCIDQLDALSFVSGRNVQGREVLEELIVQAMRTIRNCGSSSRAAHSTSIVMRRFRVSLAVSRQPLAGST